MTDHIWDVLVIGGGINGTGIAYDCAGRGLKVLLVEKHDLACATSSASSKLIHGGLRYLEQYAFGLVRESLREREILLRTAPHLVKPLRFIMPHHPSMRPRWMMRIGLFLYDTLATRKILPRSSRWKAGSDSLLKPQYKDGFSYYDCSVDDSRLVLALALSAQEKGATIRTGDTFEHATQQDGIWYCSIAGQTVRAKCLVNAAGPWVNTVLQNLPAASDFSVRLVKGSHIVVPKITPHNQAYILQNNDKRVIFVTPYQEHYSMIGTTDIPFEGDAASIYISDEEITYLCDSVNTYFKKSISRNDIINTWSGVRSLLDNDKENPSEVTRDYKLEWLEKGAPLLNVFGGKLTTYRALSEKAAIIIAHFFDKSVQSWTTDAILVGGCQNFEAFCLQAKQQYSWLPTALYERYVRQFGIKIHDFLKDIHHIRDLGIHFGHGLYEHEVRYFYEKEFARTADDILFRRTKLGIIYTPEEREKLCAWCNTTMTAITL